MKEQHAFTMSVVHAVLAIRDFKLQNAGQPFAECCRLLRCTPGVVAQFDYDGAHEMRAVEKLFVTCGGDRECQMRDVLKTLLFHFRPSWALLIPYGRQVLARNASKNVRQCFETAGLFRDPPDPECIKWWTEMAEYFRSEAALGRAQAGKKGELLTMESERKRLIALGRPDLEPVWKALDDETLGYDVLSYDLSSGSPMPLHIEVKASDQLPFSFYLSENEWDVALHYGPAYRFHFWYLPAKRLEEASVKEVAPHVPENRGSGSWRKTQISWESFK